MSAENNLFYDNTDNTDNGGCCRKNMRGMGMREVSAFVVEAGALDGVGAYLGVGYGDVGGVGGVGLQGGGRFEGAVEHDIAVGGRQAAVDVYSDVEDAGHYAFQALKPLFDALFHGLFLLFGELRVECPENDMLYHSVCVVIVYCSETLFSSAEVQCTAIASLRSATVGYLPTVRGAKDKSPGW